MASARPMLITIALLVATIVAIVTGWLVRSTNASVQNALLYGGGAFSGTTVLVILLMDKAGLLT